jgi:hypothetical protein
MKALILLVCILLSGCVMLNQGYVHPGGDKQVCRSAGFGWLGVPTALILQMDCGNGLKDRGYVEE